jgi:hypothetical protein
MTSLHRAQQQQEQQQHQQDDENRSCHQGSVCAEDDNDSTIILVDGGHEDMTKRPDRNPLCSLNLNHNSMNTSSSHNSQQHTKDGSTPHSLKSRGSLVVDNNKYGRTMDPIKLRYVLTPHYDDDHVDDSGTHLNHGYESAQEDYNYTRNIHSLSPSNNISHDMNSMSGTASIGTSQCNKSTGVDYDSVIYSGYAGSVSAAPSELSDGYSVEDDDGKDLCGNGRNGNVWSNALQSAVGGAESSKRGRRNRPLVVARGREVEHSDDGSASCRGDFSMQMKKMREQRRKKRLDSMKDYRASILTEFRAFLSRNGRDGNKCDDKNDDVPGENGSNATLKTPNMKRARERCESNDFTPTYIHGHIPWIVFEKDLEEDLSTIHGGSRCEGLAGSPKSEMALEQNSGALNRLDHGIDEEHASVEQDHDVKRKMTTCIGSNNGERMEMVYILLLVLSIATVVAVVAIVVVQL